MVRRIAVKGPSWPRVRVLFRLVVIVVDVGRGWWRGSRPDKRRYVSPIAQVIFILMSTNTKTTNPFRPVAHFARGLINKRKQTETGIHLLTLWGRLIVEAGHFVNGSKENERKKVKSKWKQKKKCLSKCATRFGQVHTVLSIIDSKQKHDWILRATS